MALLSGPEIVRQIELGNITIDPFDPKNAGPNSYDVTLAPVLMVYQDFDLDMRKQNPTLEVTIPEEGYWLEPGRIYLASTVERVGSKVYVPCLEGRSSLGRLGISCHCCAGYGDLGFLGTYTLELSVIQPVKIYAGVRIGQIAFHTVENPSGEVLYSGKYNGQTLPRESRMWKDREFQAEGV